MEITVLVPLITNFGFPIALVIYLLVADKRNRRGIAEREEKRIAESLERERRLGERIDEVEDSLFKELVAVSERYAANAEADREILKRLLRNWDITITNLEKRPCMGVDQPGPPGRILDGTLPRAQDPTGQTTGRTSVTR